MCAKAQWQMEAWQTQGRAQAGVAGVQGVGLGLGKESAGDSRGWALFVMLRPWERLASITKTAKNRSKT